MQDIQERTRREKSDLLQGLIGVAREVEERLNAALDGHGLSMPKLTVLQILMNAGEPIALGVVSERFGCVKSNITQLVDRLEVDHLVRRGPDPSDRRSVLASITEEGRRRSIVGQFEVDRITDLILNDLSDADRHELERLIHRLRSAREPAPPDSARDRVRA